MQFITVLACLASVAWCAPTTDTPINLARFLPAKLHEEVHDEFGQYVIRYVTGENTVVSERGRLVPSEDGFVLEIEGQYQFLGDDGKIYRTTYKGGKDGFQVEGDHIPSNHNHINPVPKINN